MEITEELRTLAKFTAGPIPVISVYLNTQWRDPQQRARVTTFFERHLHQALRWSQRLPRHARAWRVTSSV